MATLFVSDLHLDASRPEATDCFLRFLRDDAQEADALYILGDLFESWVGDDDPNPHHRRVTEALAELSQSGVPTYFMRGNRDLMIGDRFAKDAGITLLPDPTLVYVEGSSVLLSHGDLYCTDDTGYQRYRRFVHHPLSQMIYHSLPFSIRNLIVNGVRARSKSGKTRKTPEIMDVSQEAVERAAADHNVNLLLHGHTHRPALHDFETNGMPAKRIVLGDWYEQGNTLRWNADGPQMQTLDAWSGPDQH